MKPKLSMELNETGVLSWSHHEYFYVKFAAKNVSSYNIVCRWFKYSLVIIVGCILSLFWKVIFDRYHIDFTQIYETEYKLYYINDSILMIYCSVSIIGFIFIFIDDTLYGFLQNYKKMIYITLILYIFVLIVSLLSFLVRNTLHGLINHESSTFCKTFICDEFTVYDIWIYVLNPGLLPIIMLISTIIILSIFKIKISSKMMNNGINNHNESDLELGLLASSELNEDKELILEDIQSTFNRFSCYILYLFMYFISILLFFAASNININVLETQFEITYAIFLISICIYKWMMKLIARLCDHYRFKSSDYNYYISLEYLTEWIYGLMYWIWLRNNWQYHQPQLVIFILQLLCTHILTEIIATNIRYSMCYYNVLCKLLEKHSSSNDNYSNLMQFILSDAININVYRTHLAICIMTRFYIAIITGFIHLFYLLIVGHQSIDDIDSDFDINNYYEAMFHGVLLLFAEIVYFGMVFQVQKDILAAFTDYVVSMQNMHKMLLMFLYFSFLSFLWI